MFVRKRPRTRRLGLLAAVGLFAFAVAATSSFGFGKDATNLRIGMTSPTLNFDPTIVQSLNDYVTNTLVSGQLYRFSPKGVKMDLLASERISANGRTVTHTLRPGLKYSDGTPVTAQDAVYAFNRLKKAGGSPITYFSRVKSASAPNDRTIVWKLKARFPDFRFVLAREFLLLHPWKQIEAKGAANYFTKPVSAGPLVVDSWTPGGPSLRVTANPNYWRKPVVDSVEFVTAADPTSRALQLQQGAVDYVLDLPFASKGTFGAAVRTFAQPQGGMLHMAANLQTDGPLGDARVRQAISLAINRTTISQKAFAGLPEPACSQLYKIKPYSCTLPFKGVQNLAAARTLLKQTKYPKGFSFELQVWNRPGWPDAALLVAQDLAKIGIKVKVTTLEQAVAIANLNSGNFEMQFEGNIGFPPSIFLQSQFYPGGLHPTWSHYRDRKTVKLIDRATLTSDPKKNKALIEAAQRNAYKTMTFIPVVERVVLRGSRVSANVVGTTAVGDFLVIGTVPR